MYSSCFNLGALILVQFTGSEWGIIFLAYRFFSLPLASLGHAFNFRVFSQRRAPQGFLGAVGLVLILLNLSGVPPLPGFFLKLTVFSARVAVGRGVLASLMALSSVALAYCYLIVGMKLLTSGESRPVFASPASIIGWASLVGGWAAGFIVLLYMYGCYHAKF